MPDDNIQGNVTTADATAPDPNAPAPAPEKSIDERVSAIEAMLANFAAPSEKRMDALAALYRHVKGEPCPE